MMMPMPTMIRNAKKGMATGGRSARGILQAPDDAVRVVRQDEAAEDGNLDRIAVGLAGFVRNGEKRQRHAARRFPMGLDGSELCRLVLERVQAVQVADEDLQGHEDAQKPQRHRKHDAALVDETTAPDQVGRHRSDNEGGGDIEADNRMGESVREGRVEDDLEPILGEEASSTSS